MSRTKQGKSRPVFLELYEVLEKAIEIGKPQIYVMGVAAFIGQTFALFCRDLQIG